MGPNRSPPTLLFARAPNAPLNCAKLPVYLTHFNVFYLSIKNGSHHTHALSNGLPQTILCCYYYYTCCTKNISIRIYKWLFIHELETQISSGSSSSTIHNPHSVGSCLYYYKFFAFFINILTEYIDFCYNLLYFINQKGVYSPKENNNIPSTSMIITFMKLCFHLINRIVLSLNLIAMQLLK